jgi:hypothetical protein
MGGAVTCYTRVLEEGRQDVKKVVGRKVALKMWCAE